TALLVLFAQLWLVAPLENLTAQRIDRLALLVHHVVVLEQILADVEVVALDAFLRVLDGAIDQRVLDRDILCLPELLRQAGNALGSENAQKIVLERHVEARRAGIPLAARTATKLVVDAPRLVTLGAENVQTARGQHLLALAAALLAILGQRL